MIRNLIFVGNLSNTGFTGALGDGVLKMFKVALRAFKLLRTMAFTSCILK